MRRQPIQRIALALGLLAVASATTAGAAEAAPVETSQAEARMDCVYVDPWGVPPEWHVDIDDCFVVRPLDDPPLGDGSL